MRGEGEDKVKGTERKAEGVPSYVSKWKEMKGGERMGRVEFYSGRIGKDRLELRRGTERLVAQVFC